MLAFVLIVFLSFSIVYASTDPEKPPQVPTKQVADFPVTYSLTSNLDVYEINIYKKKKDGHYWLKAKYHTGKTNKIRTKEKAEKDIMMLSNWDTVILAEQKDGNALHSVMQAQWDGDPKNSGKHWRIYDEKHVKSGKLTSMFGKPEIVQVGSDDGEGFTHFGKAEDTKDVDEEFNKMIKNYRKSKGKFHIAVVGESAAFVHMVGNVVNAFPGQTQLVAPNTENAAPPAKVEKVEPKTETKKDENQGSNANEAHFVDYDDFGYNNDDDYFEYYDGLRQRYALQKALRALRAKLSHKKENYYN